jgi:DNA-directed RNA polymerase subunit RPC12/RpoP
MAISFQCTCGRTLRVKDELAGRRARCPKCSSILTIPKPDIEYDAADVSVVDTPSDAEKEPGWDEPEAPASTAITDRSLYRAPAPVKKCRPASKRERKKERRRLPMVFINGEVAIGFVMIVVAIAWFVGGLLWLNRIFFYPPVLLILGIAAIYKGFTAPE